MNPAQLLTHFDRIGEAPDAIPRLRRFILDLAVRGKLVEQDPRDEPASELLRRIQAEKERLIKAGKIKQQKSLPPLPDLDVPFSIPDSWVWERLDTLTEKITDGEHLSPNKTTTGMPLLTATHVTSQGVTLNNPQFVSIKHGHKSRQRCDPLRGDLLICSRGTIGRCAVVNTDEIFCLMGSVILARFTKETTPAYFNYFLSTDRAQMQMRGMSSATAVQALYLKDIRLCPVALPPLAEQHRIVAKMDELMALCDRLEAAKTERENRRDRLVASSLYRLNNGADADAFREHARFYFNHLPRLTNRPDHIKKLRQTILNLAVRGKLVEQDPTDEPASVLYQRLSSQLTKAQQIERSRPRRDILPSAMEFFSKELFPTSWVLTNFDQLNAIVSGVAKGKDLRGRKTATYPYLRVANVQRGYLNLAIVKNLEICADEFNRYQLRRGDVLMTEGGDWDKLGRAAIWNEEVPNCIHQNHIYRIRSANNEELLPDWIVLFANSPLGRSYFEGASKQTTNLASINMTQLRSCPLPLPPLPEQHRIVAKVDELMALCDQLETQLTTTQSETQKLLEAILHDALALENK